ncbi:META domain-containing protein [Mangrovibacterium sp.]|uniref:META domain-containing protein n=1 Tax=Mangrovibacterium sp. TaxID=1961364 RepID=UPI00356243A0
MKLIAISIFLLTIALASCITPKLTGPKKATKKDITIRMLNKLNGKWALKAIQEEPTNAGEEIFIDFISKESRFMGKAGCNSINGTIEVNANQLKIGSVLRTKMFCPDRMELEEKLISLLQQSSWIISCTGDKLVLKNENNRLDFYKIVTE